MPSARAIGRSSGVDDMTSSSKQGVSTITVQLKLNYDPYTALTQITSKVNQVRNQLPAEAEVPIIDVQVGETTAAMYLSFSSTTLDENQITDYLTRVVQPKLAAIGGVQSAQVLGGRVKLHQVTSRPGQQRPAPAIFRLFLCLVYRPQECLANPQFIAQNVQADTMPLEIV